MPNEQPAEQAQAIERLQQQLSLHDLTRIVTAFAQHKEWTRLDNLIKDVSKQVPRFPDNRYDRTALPLFLLIQYGRLLEENKQLKEQLAALQPPAANEEHTDEPAQTSSNDPVPE